MFKKNSGLWNLALAACLVLVVQPTICRAENYAVLAAVEDYTYVPDLDYAIDDIYLIRDMLVNVADWSSANITMLEGSAATKSAILSAIYDLRNTIDSDDNFLFMFSGHGHADGLGLLPHLADVNPTYIITPGTLNAYLDVLETDRVVVILDASKCHVFNNQIGKGVVLMSTDGGETFEDGVTLYHGVFSYFVGQGMEGYADLTGASISAEDVFNYADPLVEDWTDGWEDGPQDPLMDDNYPGQLEFLVKSMTLSGPLSHGEFWSTSSLTLTGDVTVPSGETLKILTGTTVDLNGHTLRCIGSGLIDKEGTVTDYEHYAKKGSYYTGFFQSSATIQQIINWASSYWDIYIGSGTYNESITLKSHVDVIGEWRDNTTINGTANVDGYLSKLHGFTVTGSIHSFGGGGQIIEWVKAQGGIELDYGAEKYITSVIVTGNSTSAIDAFQTDTYIDGLMAITVGNTYGVYARQYADVVLDGYQIENKERGVYLYNRADAYISDFEFCDNTYDIYAGYASYAEVVDDIVFSGDPAVKTYGDVDYPEEWDECHGLKKAIVASAPDATDPAAQAANANDPGVSDYRKALASLHAIKQKLMADLKADITPDPRNYKSDYEAAIDQFKQVVARYPGTPSSLKAIARVSACNFSLDRPEEVYDYVNSVAKSPEFSAVKHEVLSFLIPYHVNQKDYDQALQLSDELLENSTDDDFACGILLGEGIIHREGRQDLASAAEVFRRIIADYPDNPTAVDAQDQLARMGESVPGGSPTEPETVEALALEGYPNPFNPTATIRFGLPETGKVTLVVYDLMGREVVRLLEEGHLDAGWQAVVWDGRNAKGREVPTGIYIARLVTPQGTKAIKLVMMK